MGRTGDYIREGLGAVICEVWCWLAGSQDGLLALPCKPVPCSQRPALCLPALLVASAASTIQPLTPQSQVPNPEFEGQTKTRLGNPEVRKVVEGVVAAGAHAAHYMYCMLYCMLHLCLKTSFQQCHVLPWNLRVCQPAPLASFMCLKCVSASAGATALLVVCCCFRVLAPLVPVPAALEMEPHTAWCEPT